MAAGRFNIFCRTTVAALGVLLGLGGCSAERHGWPNLASVPDRAEAYRLTPKPPSAAGIAVPQPNHQTEVQDVQKSLTLMQVEVADLAAAFTENQSNFKAEVADYEKAVRQMAASGGSLAEGNESLATAQLYLSRLSRSRDNLRRTAEKIESESRNLAALKGRIAEMGRADMAAEEADISQKLDKLDKSVPVGAATANAYVAGELDRMKILSADGVKEALRVSPAPPAGPPDMVLPAAVDDAALALGLGRFLAGAAPRASFRLWVFGDDAALRNRNQALVRAMAALLDKSVALDRISLGVATGEGASPLQIRFYISK